MVITSECTLGTLNRLLCKCHHPSLLVCDGASCNLTAIKSTMGLSRTIGQDPSLTDPDKISPFLINSFDPSRSIYWLIYPSYQVSCVCVCVREGEGWFMRVEVIT